VAQLSRLSACWLPAAGWPPEVWTADLSADGRRSTASQTAIGRRHIISLPPDNNLLVIKLTVELFHTVPYYDAGFAVGCAWPESSIGGGAFNGPLSRTTWVSQYQKGKTSLDFTGARDSEWQWLITAGPHASAPCSRQITMPAPHCSVFYRPDALPAAQPTASKH